MSFHIIPKTGEPKHLTESYWDKEDKKHKSKKIAYVYLWAKNNIDRLKTMVEDLAKAEKNANNETKEKSFRVVEAAKVRKLESQIDRFKRTSTKKVKFARSRIDARRLSPKVKEKRRSRKNKALIRGEYDTGISILRCIIEADIEAGVILRKCPVKKWKQHKLASFLRQTENLQTLIQEAIRYTM
jgi:hypothetical protein